MESSHGLSSAPLKGVTLLHRFFDEFLMRLIIYHFLLSEKAMMTSEAESLNLSNAIEGKSIGRVCLP